MDAHERYKRSQRAEKNAGKPLGGGLDEQAAPPGGRATVGQLCVEKPVEQDGERGLRISFVLHAEGLGKARLVVETTLHDQLRGQLRSGLARLADSQGLLNGYEIVSPPDDGPFARQCALFVPFSAVEVERAGELRCFARVRILEAERGSLAEEEAAFTLQAG
jgi:hypothetical protein